MSGKTANEFKSSLFMSGLNCMLLSHYIYSVSQTDLSARCLLIF